MMDNDLAAALRNANEARRKLGDSLAALAKAMIRRGADREAVQKFVDAELGHIEAVRAKR